MSKIRSIHLSDIHYKVNNYNTERLRESLLDKIVQCGKGYYKYLFITGDFLYCYENCGSFKEVSEYIEKILQVSGIKKEYVFLVPGNHDIERSVLRSIIISGLKNDINSISKTIDVLDDKVYEGLIKGQENFIKFYKNILGRDYSANDLHYLIETEDMNILGINTCLISGMDEEEGSLSIGLKKLWKCVNSLDKSNNKYNIAILHHSLECINAEERDEIKKLLVDYNFNLILCGHTHKSKFDEIIIGSKVIRIVCSGTVANDQYADVNFIDIEIEDGKTNIIYYKWSNSLSEWRRDVTSSRSADDAGIITFKINKDITIEEEKKLEIKESFFNDKITLPLVKEKSNMKKKLQVFISSTYTDLIEERQAAVEAILDLEHIPVGMELFKSGKKQMETIEKWIDESDIYMLILGGRYGSIDKESNKSYTQLEYEYALKKGMPVFAIVIDENEIDNRVVQRVGKGAKVDDVKEVENAKQYNKFRDFVLSNICGFFKDEKDIKIEVYRQIHDIQIKSAFNEIKKLSDENSKLNHQIKQLAKIEVCDDRKKDECNETLAGIYSEDNMKREYNKFLEDSNDVYILVGDLDFLLEPSGKEQLRIIKELGNKCKILCREKDNFSIEVKELCKELSDVGVKLKCYSIDAMNNIKNIKGQFKIDSKKNLDSLIICKKDNKFRLINFDNNGYLNEIFMKEVKELFSKEAIEFRYQVTNGSI